MNQEHRVGCGHPENWLPVGLLAPLAVLLAGCTVGPDYEVPHVDVPATWHAETMGTGGLELSNWWQRLSDPFLDALIDTAFRNNLDVATARAKIREARASLREAGGALAPTVTGSGSATRSETASSNGASQVVQTSFRAGFDASWELDLFGAEHRKVEAAAYGVDAAEEDLRTTLLTLIGDIAGNYVDARAYRERMGLARRTADSYWRTATLTRAKVNAGAANASDLAKTEGQANETEASIPTLEISYAEAVHRLGVLTGQAPASLSVRLDTPAMIPSPPGNLPTGVPAALLSARPDIKAAERRLAQSTALVGEAEAARYPSVSLTGSLATSGTSIAELARRSSVAWSFGPSVNIPIFNGGSLAAAVDVAAAQRDQYEIAFRAAVLSGLEDVENALVGLSQQRRRLERLDASVTSYRLAASIATVSYQNGGSSALDLLDADRSLYSAESDVIDSRAAVARAFITLNKALGGGWDGAVDTDGAPPSTPTSIRSAPQDSHNPQGAVR